MRTEHLLGYLEVLSEGKTPRHGWNFVFTSKGEVKDLYCYDARPLLAYNTVRLWFEGVKPSLSYKRHGLIYLREFCEYTGKDPDQLITERVRRLHRTPDALVEENWLRDWHQRQLQSGYMASSAQAKFSKIVSFFNFNHIRLKIARFPRVTDDQYRGPKRLQKEEILKMISLCEGHRDKLLLMIGAESGLRVRALSVLKLNHLVSSEDGSDEGVPTTSLRNLYSATIPCRIQLPKRFYLGKKREGIAFLCRDAVETLARYLEERRARGEPITGDTPLLPTYKAIFRMVDNNARVAGNIRDWHAVGTRIMLHQRRPPGPKGDLTAVEAEILEIEVAPVSASFLEKTMQRLRTLAEITYDPKKERPCSCHSLRKYLHCTLDVGGVNANMVNVIIGHANSISDHYSGKKYLDLEEIRHAYSSAIHRITITGKTNLRQLSDLEERIKLLEGENENLKRQLAHFRGVSQAENERATENLAN